MSWWLLSQRELAEPAPEQPLLQLVVLCYFSAFLVAAMSPTLILRLVGFFFKKKTCRRAGHARSRIVNFSCDI